MSWSLGGEERMRAPETSLTLSEFVERVFIPEFVMAKRAAGRAHFRAILKHILSPERPIQAFRLGNGAAKTRLREIPGWPYLDDKRLLDVAPESVAQLIEACLGHGYSVQMATHLRNVIRNIFSQATLRGYYSGPNPAGLVKAPAIVRKKARVLSLPQLKHVMELTRFPEQHIALFALLTDMNTAEICGLKWKYVNLSNVCRYVSGEPVPARSIVVRMQSYRGEYRTVLGRRARCIPIQGMLHSALQLLSFRNQFVCREDFVLSSRSGTPINPDNIAIRHLKPIANAVDMPWLSWKVFHCTGISLKAQFGKHLHKELERALTLKLY